MSELHKSNLNIASELSAELRGLHVLINAKVRLPGRAGDAAIGENETCLESLTINRNKKCLI